MGLVLIVEDNIDNSKLMIKLLEYCGHVVHLSEDGESAVEFCEDHEPELILMDITLPRMNGLEATREIRKMPQHEGTPIVAVTAHALGGVRQDAKNAGCTDFLAKPFLPTDFRELVERYLGGKD